MSDALSANRLEPQPPVDVIECFCLAHGLRQFSDIEEAFPQACAYVLGILDQVFEHERVSAERSLSAAERLVFHQQHSAPLMAQLHRWLEQPIEHREVEPSSSLGKAFNYLLKHWQKLTQFLRIAGAPLDNNVVEVRFVDPKPKRFRPWGMGPEPKRGNDRWFENLIPV
jgi:hypothetical protein